MARAITLSAANARWTFGSLGLARIGLALIFLWAFFDKLFGLGFATCRDAATNNVAVSCAKAWMEGGSPTAGFLSHATGPFATLFHNLAGQGWADWLFMIGLLGLGISLTLGLAVRISAIAGSVLLFLMWAAGLWPATNPLLDDHIIYILLLISIAAANKYQMFGLGSWWRKQPVIEKNAWLQ
jgi:thiosulfate dehydrogenase [quinone] large subunit